MATATLRVEIALRDGCTVTREHVKSVSVQLGGYLQLAYADGTGSAWRLEEIINFSMRPETSCETDLDSYEAG